MLKHQYQSWYSEYLHMSPTQWNITVVSVLALAALSVLKPDFFAKLTVRFLRKGLKIFRLKKGGQGITLANEFIPDEARLRHTHIVGATGSGKTVTLEQLMFEDLARGHGALVIDPKGDRELYDRLKAFCKSIGREKDLNFLSSSWSDESVRWNPCRLGNASELQSKWYNSGVYREPHYAKACEVGLLEAFNHLLVDQPEGFGLTDLTRQLQIQAKSSKSDNLEGLFYELQNFSVGEWGPLLCAMEGPRPSRERTEVTLLEITQKNEILFVDLPTESKALQSARIGKLLLQEMMLISGLRKRHPELKSSRPFSIFIDEFDAFATENFATFQNKGRSSDFMIHIAHQTLSDLEKVSPMFKGQIMGNCNVRFIFRQDSPDDAELWSKFLGTKTVVKKTFQTEDGFMTGRSSNRETQEFLIHPDKIKNLKTGQCVFSMKTEKVLRELKIPYPPKWPKRKIADLQRSAAGSFREAHFDTATDEIGGILEEARKSKQKKGVTDHV